VKFGLLVHGTSGNVGDAIQSLAALRFLPRVDRLVERERLGAIASAGPIKVIMNGWWMKCPEHWPPPPNVIPLFVSFHVTTGPARAAMVTDESVAYLRRHEPIGCRDLDTTSFLRAAGIDAYFSGCLTMTLPPRPRKLGGEVLFVDPFRGHFFAALPPALANAAEVRRLRQAAGSGESSESPAESLDGFLARMVGMPEAWRGGASHHSALVSRELGPRERFRAAEAMLERLAAARLVVTSRLHAVLPAMALGTPALFVLKDEATEVSGRPDLADKGHDCTRHDPRLPGLFEQTRHVTLSQLLGGLSGEVWRTAVEEPMRLRADLIAGLEARVADFLGDDLAAKAVAPAAWLPSPEVAARGFGRWRSVYPSATNVRAPHVCYGAVKIDLRDRLDPIFSEAGVLELHRPFLQGINGRAFSSDGTLLADHSWYGRHIDELGLTAPRCQGEPVAGVSMSLASDFGHKNFCHFVLDGLCRLHLFEAAGIRVEAMDRVYCPPPPSANARRLLDRLGIPEEKFVWLSHSTVARPETLHLATFPGSRRNFPRWLPGFVQKRWPVTPTRADRRLFVSRSGYRRSASNEAEVRRLLVAAGFEIYDPAKAADSQKDFAEAAVVVGAHGAALANLAWCRPGTKILELFPSDHIHPYYYALAESAGLEYGCLVGRSLLERVPGAQGPSWSDFHVDQDELAAAVAAITAP
jgi:hypothetical protein